MLQLNFSSISENKPGKKWQHLFNTHWPAYHAWFELPGMQHKPSLEKAQAMLKQYMPKFVPTYKKLCKLAGNEPDAMRFLTGYQPPAYITGCSQVVWEEQPQLVRNYDYDPYLCEGTLLHSTWNGKQVIAVGDCLWGVIDGMNSDGLVASLTFGGRKVVGEGFGIPFILRYILEFCTNVDEAVKTLKKIPSHMSYNVMLLDKLGRHKLLQIAPDKSPIVLNKSFSTNHQGEIDWPQHASFTQTVEREKFIQALLRETSLSAEKFAKFFLKPPLFNRQYTDGFGTIYTSVYRPAEGYMELRWEQEMLHQSFADFNEGDTLIEYSERLPSQHGTRIPVKKTKISAATKTRRSNEREAFEKEWSHTEPSETAKLIAQSIGNAMGEKDAPEFKKVIASIEAEAKSKGQIPWEKLADVWTSVGSFSK